VTKLIILDLDNTLLRSDKSISDYSVSVLKKCQYIGIKVAFATARSTQSAAMLLARFTPDIFIGYGGALALANSEVIYRCDIPADISFALVQDCLREPSVQSILAINESSALTNNMAETRAEDTSHYTYCDFSEDNGIGYLKISLVASSQSAVEKIAARYPMCDMLRYTGEDLYRFANRNAVKWHAIKAVAEHFDFSIDELVAFGDDINDLEMIRGCGIGVAVANAVGEVKKAAKFICGSNDEDGAAKWLEEYISSVSSGI